VVSVVITNCGYCGVLPAAFVYCGRNIGGGEEELIAELIELNCTTNYRPVLSSERVEYFHRSLASHKRRRKGNPVV
jgi:hypothetical protein